VSAVGGVDNVIENLRGVDCVSVFVGVDGVGVVVVIGVVADGVVDVGAVTEVGVIAEVVVSAGVGWVEVALDVVVAVVVVLSARGRSFVVGVGG
jgi:hypothetical protein